MEYGFLYSLIRQAILLGIFSAVFGCASNPAEPETFIGEGFQSSLPKAGTRVVVWGNHPGAVMSTLGWLDDHQILSIDPSWIEKELTDPEFYHWARMEQEAKMLAAAKSVGASLVLFAQVEDSQVHRKFDLMNFDHKFMKIIGVEIRGTKVETGDVVFGARAWNSEPLVESQQIVKDLTTFALEKAWNESGRPLPLQQEVAELEQQREPVTAATSYSEETPPTPETSKVETLELQLSDEEPSLGPQIPLQQEVVQQRRQQEQVTTVPPYSEEMAPSPEASKTETVESRLSDDEEPSLGLQIAGGALSVLYTPLKVGYAGLGGLMGGLAYLLTAGNEQVAQSIWDASLHGTYWLTAKHLQGEEAINFKGESSQIDQVHQARLDKSMDE